ncbi:MAG: D-aminoacylase [Nitrospirae bacterium]|nr:D-aminoacylase [Nitrospirota bacterium]
MSELDLLIKNGLVVDGSGGPDAFQDIGIKDGKIAAVGRLHDARATSTLDASNLVVTPGFIDIHAHSEYHLLIHPQATSKVRQGVTTEICGNCGYSAAPLYGEVLERRKEEYRSLGLEITWSTLAEFRQLLEGKGIGVNVATFTGHGNVRGSVLGYRDSKPTREEQARMEALMEETLIEGALGLSTGLIYPPGVYADRDEITSLAAMAARYGGLYATHMRSEGDQLVEAVEESIDICRRGGIPLQISHLKTSGQANWSKIHEVFRRIESARDEGLAVHCDRYPYTAASTDLDVVLPAWAYEGGSRAEMERLREPAVRKRLADEIRKVRPYVDAWDRILIGTITTEKNKVLEGKTLTEAVRIRHTASGGTTDPLETLFDILLEENLQVTAHFFSMSEENLRRILKKPYVMVGSDSSVRSFEGPLSCGKPHPRGFGTFPRVIQEYVNRERVLSLEEAIHKMTGLPARTLGLRNRGLLREGYWADLAVFDPDGIADRSTFPNPFHPPEGIHHVLVNGAFVVRDQQPTGVLPGVVLGK